MNFHLVPSLLCEQARRSSAKWAQLSHGCCCYTAHYGLPRQGCWMVCVLGRTVLASRPNAIHHRPAQQASVFTSRPTIPNWAHPTFFFGFSGLLDTSDHNCGTSAVNKHWRRVAIKKNLYIFFSHLLPKLACPAYRRFMFIQAWMYFWRLLKLSFFFS